MKQEGKYDHKEIEEKWRKKWEDTKIYQPDLDKSKKPFYNLMMFPYPSAEGLHVGSVFTFTGVDTYGRFKRMQGHDVFEPMGLDGFGIHSENYALKVGKHPKIQAKISEENFYRQLRSIGNSFDWSRKLETYDPNYYKWTQWIFIQLFKRGLAYRKKAPVNFCPKDLTVLADEQVIDGKCERCGSIVEKRDLEQWFFKITNYADRLLANIPKLNWTEKVKIAQRLWIGKKEGTRILFSVHDNKGVIEVFTTRADTLYGATFIVLAPEHPLVDVILNSFQDLEIPKQVRNDIEKYVVKAKKKTEQERLAEGKDKTGVFSGIYAINPINQEKLPVWVADYALMGYGTGALFGDAHDQRDVVFAKKYGIPLKPTLITGDKEKDTAILSLKECFIGDGILVDSGEFTGLASKEAREKVVQWLEKHKKGGRHTTYHLRDWLISRQRYWGAPIPMVYCESCARKGLALQGETLRGYMAGWYPVAEKDLPVLLPDVKDWKPKGTGEGPLANAPEFVKARCPQCGLPARRETDVIDTFLDSSWYFLRYLATEWDDVPFPMHELGKEKNHNTKFIIHNSSQRLRWLPVTIYIGGAEHSVLHLLYSRFITMAFKDMGLIDFEEPYTRFYAHGLIIKDGAKMSKSRGNVINPDVYLDKYGADTMRAYLRFVGPFDMGGDFRDSGIEGMHRFLNRVYRLVSEVSSIDKKYEENLDRAMHKAIKQITEDLENLRFNTGIAHIMEYYKSLSEFHTKYKILDTVYIKTLVLLLAPIAPFLAEELWEKLGGGYSVHQQQWPKYDPKTLKEDVAIVVVQVNGRLRDTLRIPSSEIRNQKHVEQKAFESANVTKHLSGKDIKKVVYIEGKIINFVTKK